MKFHPNNRPYSVNAETGNFLFTIYKILFDSDVDIRVKQRTLETAAESRNSWRVVSISQAALDHITQYRNTKGLQRGHILSRKDRALNLFDRDHPLNQQQLLKYFFENDTVALVTKAENSKNGTTHWSKLFEVPEDLFTAGSFSVYARKNKELIWVDSFFKNS